MESSPKIQRLASIDQFRGLGILLMVIVNQLSGVEAVPAWLKHAPDIGFTIADLVAPMFIFAMALTFEPSLRRRMECDGLRSALQHFITRALALVGLGAILSSGENLVGYAQGADWGVLQALGIATLLALPCLFLPVNVRWLCGLALLAFYQVMLDRFWLQPVLQSSHGGILGALSWSSMLILGTSLASIFHSNRLQKFNLGSTILLLVGIALAFLSPLSKNRVSSSYVLITLGASGLLFSLFDLWAARFRLRWMLLNDWGKNPLLIYLLHNVLLAFLVLPSNPAWFRQAPLWLALLQMVLLLGLLAMIAAGLRKRNFVFSL